MANDEITMEDEKHPVVQQMRANDAQMAEEEQGNKPPPVYVPTLHDQYTRESVNIRSINDQIRNAIRAHECNVHLGATHPSGGSDKTLSITASYVSVGGIGFAAPSLIVDGGVNGANGLDTGSFAASTVYHVYLITSSRGEKIAGLLSLSSTSPVMPAGYTINRHLGSCKSNGGATGLDGTTYTFDSGVTNP